MRLSANMSFAPTEDSSAGWKRARKVPDQVLREASRSAQAPSSAVVCISCPQACIFPLVAE